MVKEGDFYQIAFIPAGQVARNAEVAVCAGNRGDQARLAGDWMGQAFCDDDRNTFLTAMVGDHVARQRQGDVTFYRLGALQGVQ